MIRRPPRSTLSSSSAASDVYKRQQHKQTRNLTGYCGYEEIRPLSWSSLRKGRWIRERRARRCRTDVDATWRQPTSRLADPHSGERPLCRPMRPNTDGSVSGFDTARRIHFSFRLTNDPARSTTSADSASARRTRFSSPADSRRQFQVNSSSTSTSKS